MVIFVELLVSICLLVCCIVVHSDINTISVDDINIQYSKSLSGGGKFSERVVDGTSNVRVALSERDSPEMIKDEQLFDFYSRHPSLFGQDGQLLVASWQSYIDKASVYEKELLKYEEVIKLRLELEEGLEISEQQYRALEAMDPMPTAVPRVFDVSKPRLEFPITPTLGELYSKAVSTRNSQEVLRPHERNVLEMKLLKRHTRSLLEVVIHGIGAVEDYDGRIVRTFSPTLLEYLESPVGTSALDLKEKSKSPLNSQNDGSRRKTTFDDLDSGKLSVDNVEFFVDGYGDLKVRPIATPTVGVSAVDKDTKSSTRDSQGIDDLTSRLESLLELHKSLKQRPLSNVVSQNRLLSASNVSSTVHVKRTRRSGHRWRRETGLLASFYSAYSKEEAYEAAAVRILQVIGGIVSPVRVTWEAARVVVSWVDGVLSRGVDLMQERILEDPSTLGWGRVTFSLDSANSPDTRSIPQFGRTLTASERLRLSNAQSEALPLSFVLTVETVARLFPFLRAPLRAVISTCIPHVYSVMNLLRTLELRLRNTRFAWAVSIMWETPIYLWAQLFPPRDLSYRRAEVVALHALLEHTESLRIRFQNRSRFFRGLIDSMSGVYGLERESSRPCPLLPMNIRALLLELPPVWLPANASAGLMNSIGIRVGDVEYDGKSTFSGLSVEFARSLSVFFKDSALNGASTFEFKFSDWNPEPGPGGICTQWMIYNSFNTTLIGLRSDESKQILAARIQLKCDKSAELPYVTNVTVKLEYELMVLLGVIPWKFFC